jgi:hypothetical protein
VTDVIRDDWAEILTAVNTPAGVTVYLTGQLPELVAYRVTPYGVLYPGLGLDGGRRLPGIPRDSRVTFSIVYVGATVAQVGWIAEQVRPTLRGTRLDPASTPISMFATTQPVADNDLTPPLYTATDVWTYAAPAAA